MMIFLFIDYNYIQYYQKNSIIISYKSLKDHRKLKSKWKVINFFNTLAKSPHIQIIRFDE